MVTVGIELCDEGVLAFARQKDGEGALLQLEENTLASPGYIYRNTTSFTCGEAAERLSKLYPLDIAHNFWDRLSLKTSELTGKKDIPLFSELAYHHLKYVWERIQALVQAIDKVAFAVPSNYLQEESDSEEKVGLFLGMAADLNLPLVGLFDMACASLFTKLKANHLLEVPLLHLDIHQHNTFINFLKTGNGQLERQNIICLPRLGHTRILQRLTDKLAHQFLRQTAFDVTEERKIEQKFFQKTKELLSALNAKPESILELDDLGRTRQISVSREDIVAELKSFSETIVQSLSRAARNTDSPQPIEHVILSERAVRLPGLEERLLDAGLIPVLKLESGAAAQGAADYGLSQPHVEHLEEVPLVWSIHIDAAPIDDAAYSTKLLNPTIEKPVPSHIVFKGIAHPIRSEGLLIGAPPERNRGGILLPGQSHKKTEPSVRLYWNGNTLKIAGKFPSGLLLNGVELKPETALEVGDTLTLQLDQQALHFLLIHCPP